MNVTSDLKFIAGEPNNSGGDEDCIGAKITIDSVPSNFLLSDNGCNKPAKYICEVSDIKSNKIICSHFNGQTYAKPCPAPTCPNVPSATETVKIEDSKKWRGVKALS